MNSISQKFNNRGIRQGVVVAKFQFTRQYQFATIGHLPETLNQDLCQNLIKNIKTDNSASVLDTNLPDSKKLIFLLYNNSNIVATLNGTAYNYDDEQYPYTRLGWNSGGNTDDIRVNNKFLK